MAASLNRKTHTRTDRCRTYHVFGLSDVKVCLCLVSPFIILYIFGNSREILFSRIVVIKDLFAT